MAATLRALWIAAVAVVATLLVSGCDTRSFDTDAPTRLRLVHTLGGNVRLDATIGGEDIPIGADRGAGFLPQYEEVQAGRQEIRVLDGTNLIAAETVRLLPNVFHTGILAGEPENPSLVILPADTSLVETDQIRLRVVHAGKDLDAFRVGVHAPAQGPEPGELIQDLGMLEFGEASDYLHDERRSLVLVLRDEEGDALAAISSAYEWGMTHDALVIDSPSNPERAFTLRVLGEWHFR